MKKLWVAITLICMAISGVAGYWICKSGEQERCMVSEAITLVKSFGWQVDEGKEISLHEFGDGNFYEIYRHITGEYPTSEEESSGVYPRPNLARGNIDGIVPEILTEEPFLSHSRFVSVCKIPILYDMPEGCYLVAEIGYYDGEICQSSVKVEFVDNDIDEFNVIADKLSLVEKSKLIPTVWPLNVKKQVLEDWKTNYSSLR